MLHNLRLLFITVATSVLLVACSDGTNEKASINQTFADSVELASAKTEEVNTEASDTNSSEAASKTSVAEEEVEVETESATDDTEVIQDAIDPQVILAFEEIVKTIGIDKDDHTFIFNETEDFIEVEVREKNADGATPLLGKYRYQLKEETVLTMDYLTGEFIPHEEIDE